MKQADKLEKKELTADNEAIEADASRRTPTVRRRPADDAPVVSAGSDDTDPESGAERRRRAPTLRSSRGRARIEKRVEWANDLFERHRGRGPVDLGVRVYARDHEMAGSLVGSALAFRLFLFFVPMLLFLVGIAGLFADVVDRHDLDEAGITGTIANQIDSALNQPGATRWLASVRAVRHGDRRARPSAR